MSSADERAAGEGRGTHAAVRDQAPADATPAAPGTGDEFGLSDLLPLAIPDVGRRGPGRPRGAQNVRTNKTWQVAVSRYGDPLIASIAWGTMDTRALIREIRMIASDCGLRMGKDLGVIDIIKFQEECRRAVMPYGHARRVSVDEKGDPVLPMIGIGQFTVVAGSGAGGSFEDVIDAEIIEQNQAVTNLPAEKSQTGKSHDDATD